jgi:hypothetical protein
VTGELLHNLRSEPERRIRENGGGMKRVLSGKRRHAAIGASLMAASCLFASTPSYSQVAANLSSRDVTETDQARDTLYRFATCVVKARPRMTKEALALTSQPEANKAFQALVKPECLNGGFLRMDAAAIRGPLYRALYLREFGHNEPGFDPLPAEQPSDEDRGYHAFGACVMRVAPDMTHAFVLALPGSSEEHQALAALRPTFEACVNPKEQLVFTKVALDSTLAQALYERAVAVSHGGNLAKAN